MHLDAENFISKNAGKLDKIGVSAHSILCAEGCMSYVKTIYIGYELDGEMIAALYVRPEYIEVALSLPESFDSPILIDATHLTWKSMPVAAVLKTKSDINLFTNLAKEAAELVRSGKHAVSRDSNFFADAKRNLRNTQKKYRW